MVVFIESGALALASAFDVGIACLLFANYFADAGIHGGCERDELILADLHFVHRVLANGEDHAGGRDDRVPAMGDERSDEREELADETGEPGQADRGESRRGAMTRQSVLDT